MRLLTTTVVVRLGDDGEPDLSVDIAPEPGLDPKIAASMVPDLLRKVADDVESQIGEL